MKRIIATLGVLLAFAACNPVEHEIEIPINSLILNPTAITLTEGEVSNIVATVSPSNATNQKIIWTSSDAAVASIKEDGTLTANKAGTATITAITDEGGHKATCTVTVEAKIYPVESVSLNKTELALIEGDYEILVENVLPNNASNKKVDWSSTKPTVASVINGVVEALSPGECEIFVTTRDGGLKASCKVTVNERIYPVESVSLNTNEITLTVEDTYTLVAYVYPSSAQNKNVSWTSSNTDVATVDKGIVLAVSSGKTTITVTTEESNKTDVCVVTVKEKTYPVTDVSIAGNKQISLQTGESTQLTATVKPSNATNKNLIWSSSNNSVATVVDGLVTGTGAGTAIIKVVAEGSSEAKEVSDACLVTVTNPQPEEPENPDTPDDFIAVTGISFDPDEYEVHAGESVSLNLVFAPENATNKNVTWKVRDDDLASVEDGIVTTFVTSSTWAGTEVTATTEDGGFVASCLLYIIND